MTQYIDKDALVAELNRLIAELIEEGEGTMFEQGRISAFEDVKLFLNTIEEKEMDLEKEYKDFVEEDPVYNKLVNGIVGKAIAKHFFELGLKASNPLTWNDMMIIHKCCKDAMNFNLYAWETAEGQQKIYEDVLKRFKAQKGE